MSAGVDPVETTERVAEAMWRAAKPDGDPDTAGPLSEQDEFTRLCYERMAEAAIAALRLTEEHDAYSWLPDDPPQYIEDGPDEGALILHRYKVPRVRLVGPWVQKEHQK